MIRQLCMCSVVLVFSFSAHPLDGIESVAFAAVIGEWDDFQDSTTQGWISGNINPVPPITIDDEGPSGLGDAFLQIRTTGSLFGPGSRLIAFNQSQWQGDYISEGIGAIAADVRNPNPIELNLRMAFDGPGGQFVSTNSVDLAAQSEWQTVVFPIGATDMTQLGGGSYEATMAAVTVARLLHNPVPSWLGVTVGGLEAIPGALDVDNVRALPEPTAGALMGIGLLTLVSVRKRP